MSEARCDYETRSDVDLKTRGAGPYFASPHWRALILCYSIDDGPIRDWTGGPCPDDLKRHIESGGWIRGFNVSFERHCFDEMARRHGWPRPAFDRYRCSMATASALGLPRSLDKLGEALGLAVKKDKRGAALIRFFSVPAKHEPLIFREPQDHPKEFAEFVSYCRQDVATEAEADRRMVSLSDDEETVYTLSETINQRGVRIDVASARAAIRLIDKEKARLDAEMAEVTGGVVTACSQAARLTAWLAAQGLLLDGVAKDDILEAFELDDLPERARRALLLRQEAAKSSTAKLTAFLRRADADDRVRGCYVYHGAAPGRWCLAEGSLVLVKTPFGDVLEKPIENVDWCDQVWDGGAWVHHSGVVFSGVKDVISHDGVTATPEHIVYLDDTSYTTLGEASRLGLKIYGGRAPIYDLHPDIPIGEEVRRDDAPILGNAQSSEKRVYDIIDAGPRKRFLTNGKLVSNSSAGGINFANLPRPRAIFDDAELDAATLFAAFRTEEPALLRTLYGDDLGKPTHLVSDALRGFLIAAPGHDFVAVDYSGIQGAIGAWLSDEKWKLQAMREIIADPTLPDLYRRAAAGILGTTTEVITKKHHMRQAVGKTSELALLFGGSIAALVGMAANYGMRRRDLHALYPALWAAADEEAREKAIKRYEQRLKSRDKQKTDVLSREAWIACKIIVDGWRRHNPASVEAWTALEAGMRDAMRDPGVAKLALGRIKYLAKSGFLWCMTPSGRCIAYASPKLKDQVWAKLRLEDGSWSEAEVVEREEAMRLEVTGRAQIQGATTPKVTALGVDSTTQKMTRYALYGGLAMENLAMSCERDILVNGMRRCEAAGYAIALHNYDEAVAEVPRSFGSVEEMERLMLDLPSWTANLPLTCHGWRGKRYAKR